MATWDRRSPRRQAALCQAALRTQVVDAVAPFSPFWRVRFAALGVRPASVGSASDLADVPAVGERDLCPDGDPAGAADLVLQVDESGYAAHSDGPSLRRALRHRLVVPRSYRAVVEADTRPTSFVYAGQAIRFPVASTRSDLDLVARAGARLWQVLGLDRSDVVVSALAPAPSALATGLSLAALASGSPLLAPGDDPVQVLDALELVRATVLVVPAAGAGDLVLQLADAGARLGSLTTVLVAGAPSPAERTHLDEALDSLDGVEAVALAVHAPDGHRLVWGECRASTGRTGLHTYPDLELVQVVDPESGLRADPGGPGELVLTQLGMRGSALLRWRTGDLVESVTGEPCPACRRTVPRVTGLRHGALVPAVALRTGAGRVDLRAVAAVLSRHAGVEDWRVVLGRNGADGTDELTVHLLPATHGPRIRAGAEDLPATVARALRTGAGVAPSAVVVTPGGVLPDGPGTTRRVLDGPGWS